MVSIRDLLVNSNNPSSLASKFRSSRWDKFKGVSVSLPVTTITFDGKTRY
jgi:hypothetical protein